MVNKKGWKPIVCPNDGISLVYSTPEWYYKWGTNRHIHWCCRHCGNRFKCTVCK